MEIIILILTAILMYSTYGNYSKCNKSMEQQLQISQLEQKIKFLNDEIATINTMKEYLKDDEEIKEIKSPYRNCYPIKDEKQVYCKEGYKGCKYCFDYVAPFKYYEDKELLEKAPYGVCPYKFCERNDK